MSIECRINVKTHGLMFDTRNAPENLIENAEFNATIRWWEQAEQIAEQHGYYGVHSDGRMGGWLVAETDNYDIQRECEFINEIESHLKSAPVIFAEELARELAR